MESTLPTFEEVAETLGERRQQWFETLGYTFWNRELLDALSERMRSDAARWVELAAGTGVLSVELERRGVSITATDDHSQHPDCVRGQHRPIRYGSWVRAMTAREAVEEYRPEAVIVAWPPLGSCMVPDLLTRAWPGGEGLGLLLCIGEPGGATEAPSSPYELPHGWHLEDWPDCDRWLIGFNDPLPGPGWRSHSRLLVYRSLNSRRQVR